MVTRRVALTGGIATGKSTVRAVFERLGVPTSDADRLARDAVAPGTPGLDAVVARFGAGVRAPDGALDRKALARLVFGDDQARRDLEAIVHPLVQAATEAWYRQLPPETPFAVSDVPLLYEVGRDVDFDAVIVAACPVDVQLSRLRARDGMTEEEARRRIAAQWPIDEKVRRADYVISTAGSPADTEAATTAVWRQLTARRWDAGERAP